MWLLALLPEGDDVLPKSDDVIYTCSSTNTTVGVPIDGQMHWSAH